MPDEFSSNLPATRTLPITAAYHSWIVALVCSGNVGGADNLAPAYYDAYVDYLTEVVQYYRDEMNITFSTVEPFNEPSSRGWQLGNVQEGCHYDASTQRTILQACNCPLSASCFPVPHPPSPPPPLPHQTFPAILLCLGPAHHL